MPTERKRRGAGAWGAFAACAAPCAAVAAVARPEGRPPTTAAVAAGAAGDRQQLLGATTAARNEREANTEEGLELRKIFSRGAPEFAAETESDSAVPSPRLPERLFSRNVIPVHESGHLAAELDDAHLHVTAAPNAPLAPAPSVAAPPASVDPSAPSKGTRTNLPPVATTAKSPTGIPGIVYTPPLEGTSLDRLFSRGAMPMSAASMAAASAAAAPQQETHLDRLFSRGAMPAASSGAANEQPLEQQTHLDRLFSRGVMPPGASASASATEPAPATTPDLTHSRGRDVTTSEPGTPPELRHLLSRGVNPMEEPWVARSSTSMEDAESLRSSSAAQLVRNGLPPAGAFATTTAAGATTTTQGAAAAATAATAAASSVAPRGGGAPRGLEHVFSRGVMTGRTSSSVLGGGGGGPRRSRLETAGSNFSTGFDEEEESVEPYEVASTPDARVSTLRVSGLQPPPSPLGLGAPASPGGLDGDGVGASASASSSTTFVLSTANGRSGSPVTPTSTRRASTLPSVDEDGPHPMLDETGGSTSPRQRAGRRGTLTSSNSNRALRGAAAAGAAALAAAASTPTQPQPSPSAAAAAATTTTTTSVSTTTTTTTKPATTAPATTTSAAPSRRRTWDDIVSALPTSAERLVEADVLVQTPDKEDHTFCGIMFEVEARQIIPSEFVEIQSVSVRGDLGEVSVYRFLQPNGARLRTSPEGWERVFGPTVLEPSPNDFVELRLVPPVRIAPGMRAGLYVHSTARGDRAIVYANMRELITYEDDMITVHPGLGHTSNLAFSDHGLGLAWREHRAFVGRLRFGAKVLLWRPNVHRLFPPAFQRAVLTVFMCQKRAESPLSRVPSAVLCLVLQYLAWDDVGGSRESAREAELAERAWRLGNGGSRSHSGAAGAAAAAAPGDGGGARTSTRSRTNDDVVVSSVQGDGAPRAFDPRSSGRFTHLRQLFEAPQENAVWGGGHDAGEEIWRGFDPTSGPRPGTGAEAGAGAETDNQE